MGRHCPLLFSHLQYTFHFNYVHGYSLFYCKYEPQAWFIKTANFGDDCNRALQECDGEFTQLLKCITRYHQVFHQGYDKIILLCTPIYTGCYIQLNAAMQCLGYTKEQFQFIVIMAKPDGSPYARVYNDPGCGAPAEQSLNAFGQPRTRAETHFILLP